MVGSDAAGIAVRTRQERNGLKHINPIGLGVKMDIDLITVGLVDVVNSRFRCPREV